LIHSNDAGEHATSGTMCVMHSGVPILNLDDGVGYLSIFI